MTAAHCLTKATNMDHMKQEISYSLKSAKFYIRPNEDEKWIQISYFKFPNKVDFTYDIQKPTTYDIALLKLTSQIRFNEFIRPICVAPHQSRCLIFPYSKS